jgi:uncharacterized protein (DUF3820 family)
VIYDGWLPLWYLLWFMTAGYPFGIFCDLWRLITPLVSSVIYDSWLPLWYLLWFMTADYPFGIFCDLWRVVTPLVSSVIYDGWLPLWCLLWFMTACYPFGIFTLFCQLLLHWVVFMSTRPLHTALRFKWMTNFKFILLSCKEVVYNIARQSSGDDSQGIPHRASEHVLGWRICKFLSMEGRQVIKWQDRPWKLIAR